MNKINPISFSSNNKVTHNSKRRKNYGTFLLAYATVCAVFPHNIDKYIDKVDINFNQLPMKDKAKNIAMVATPILGYPLLVLLGLKAGIDLYNKYKNSKEKPQV